MDKKKIKQELENFSGTQKNEKYQNMEISIALIQPENAGNIGSIARIMKNFDFENLIIFNPIETIKNIRSYEAQGFAMHGKDILLDADIIQSETQQDHIKDLKVFLDEFDLVIGTTAKGKRYTNLNRLSILVEDLEFPVSKNPLRVALLFGKESRGLTNEEIALTDILIRIPTSASYPTLNLSHACGIILYEIYKKLNLIRLGRGKNPVLLAKKSDRKILYKYVKKIIRILKIRNYRKKNAFNAFKNIFERALMSKKELSMVLGLFSKMYNILEKRDLFDG
ncbi:MAG: TrmJ/YjtD family RNA methyltransferase [Candidatus Lokiarchaeota archaeon]|nr:TrmJ/YjtD family RNA methyltransferase [Candidatus Lokiarchaeota archaeon]